MKAIREIPEEYMDKFEDIEVVVRTLGYQVETKGKLRLQTQ